MKNTLCALLLMVGASFAPSASAGWTAPGQVTYINTIGPGFLFYIPGVTTGCTDGTNQLYIDWGVAGAKELYAMVLSSMYMGYRIAANYSCNASYSNRAYTTNIDIRQ